MADKENLNLALNAEEVSKKRRAKRRKRIIAAAVAVAVVFTGGFFWWKGAKAAPVTTQSDLTEFTVARGNVTRTVSGPGAVSPVKIFTIATNLTGDIAEDFFEEGDEVAKDALLYQLDEDTTSLNFDAAQDTLSNAQDNYQSAAQDKQDLTTYADQGGIVQTLHVKKGDQISAGGRIADIIDPNLMMITLPFNSTDAEHIRVGDAAVVFLDNYGLELSGYVKKVASGQRVSNSSALITNVEIVFANPGALAPGSYGTAIVGEYACNNEGITEYAEQDTLYAAGGGKIITLDISEGDSVRVGQRVLIVENDNVGESLERAAKSLADAEKKLTNTQNNLQITSPIAGTVLAKYAKTGDTLYNTSSTLAIVADMSRLTFTIDVDELEIRYLQVGQVATVTADAYEGETFVGEVTNVGKTGTANNGVTTYPVTIEIEEYGGLLPGMNVNADIMVEQAENVLYIPVDAVTRGNMVLVKTDGSSSQAPQMETIGANEGQAPPEGAGDPAIVRGNAEGNQEASSAGQAMPGTTTQAPEGATRGANEGQAMPIGSQEAGSAGFMGAMAPAGYEFRRVETGISDTDFVEIISGLEEGEVIGYTPSVDDSFAGGFFMMGPGGGMMMTTGPGGGGAARSSTTVVRP